MKKFSVKSLVRKCGGRIADIVFFTLLYLHLWLVIEIKYIYQGGGAVMKFPAFFRGFDFFAKYLSYPGGVVEYFSAFLFQLFYHSWLGALVITALMWLICVLTDMFLKTIGACKFRILRFAGPVLLLMVYAHYKHYLDSTVAFAVSLIFTNLYLKLKLKRPSVSAVVFFVISIAAYYLCGGAVFLFIVLCGSYELFFAGRYRLGILFLLVAPLIPYVLGVLIMNTSIVNSYTHLLPLSWKSGFLDIYKRPVIAAVYILYLFLPLVTVVFGILRLTGKLSCEVSSDKDEGAVSTGWKAKFSCLWNKHAWLRDCVEQFVVLTICVFLVVSFYDVRRKTIFEVDHYAAERNWPEVLKASRKNPDKYFIVHAVDRALYHVGWLSEYMFRYPQNPAVLFLAVDNPLAHSKKVDLFIDLGLMNMAEGSLLETMEFAGERPLLIKKLALVNMVKGDIPTAKVYLGSLAKTLFFSEWAKHYLELLEHDPQLLDDKYIRRLRGIMLEEDFGFIDPVMPRTFAGLLRKNRKNRMAFEYMMAYSLMAKDLEFFTRNLKRINEFGFSHLPRSYEEALLLFLHQRNKKPDKASLPVREEVVQDFKWFIELLESRDGDLQFAYEDMKKRFHDTYMFYYLYR